MASFVSVASFASFVSLVNLKRLPSSTYYLIKYSRYVLPKYCAKYMVNVYVCMRICLCLNS